MSSHAHAQPPGDHPPCDCGGCREFRAIHAGFCAELSERERREKRINDRVAQIRWNESTAAFGPRFVDATAFPRAS